MLVMVKTLRFQNIRPGKQSGLKVKWKMFGGKKKEREGKENIEWLNHFCFMLNN